jgi:hypothetical protein
MEQYYFKTSNPNYVFGDHNGQLKDKILLHLEEAIWAGSKKDESLLKDLITGRTIEINQKFIPVFSVPNYLHLFITGNPDWLVSASFKARRFFALHASNIHIRDTRHFGGLDEWFKKGGAAHLLYRYLNYQIPAGIELRLPPITTELIEQKKRSMSGVQGFVMSMPCGELRGELEVRKLFDENGTLMTRKVLIDHGLRIIPRTERIYHNARVRVTKEHLHKAYCDSPFGKKTALHNN